MLTSKQGLFEYSIHFGDKEIRVPGMDVENYATTVEPIRLFRTLAQRVADVEFFERS